jgi:signal transduction histidine kinase
MMDSIDIQELARLGSPGFDQHLLKVLLEEMPCGVLVAEPGGRVVLANAQMDEIWRGPVGSDVSGWIGHHPDGRRYRPEEWPITRALQVGETVRSQEIEITRVDSTRGVIRFSAVPVRGAQGEIVAGVVTALDVTEQRRRLTSRRFLADAGTLLTSSLDYVSTLRNLARLAVPALADWCTVDLLDNSGEIERVAIEHSDGRRATTAMQLARRYPPTLKTEVGVERVIRTGIAELVPEVTPEILDRFTHSAKQRRFLGELGIRSVMIVPMVARGNAIGAIIFVTAESGRRYNPDDLEVAQELATRAALAVENSRLFDQSRAATEAKSDFLAVMSHELRTPLTAIIGYAELLQLGVPDAVTPRQHEQAERIEVSARHLLQLIEEILTLVTLESGERRVNRSEVEVNKLLQRAAAIIEPMARVKNLPLSVKYADGDPILRSDPDKLLQILLNLLSNAVKFTETGAIQLNAALEDHSLVIEVVDSGIGMGAEHLQRIFEPFWQVERPITRRAGGTGLGLTISRRLADLLGAEIEVRSNPGTGSTFRVRLPV